MVKVSFNDWKEEQCKKGCIQEIKDKPYCAVDFDLSQF